MLRATAIGWMLCGVLLLAPEARSQDTTGLLTGRVILDSGEPAAGAAVVLVDSRFGASAGSDGEFTIQNIPAGRYTLTVRLIGYEPAEPRKISIEAGSTLQMQITLRQSAIELGQVIVTGSRRQSAEDTRSSVSTMTPHETKYMPGGAEDVLRSLQAMPGVTGIGDYSAQLVVRGSGPDQNLIMIDGFEVLNPYRLYGFISMFNPETVSDISLQTGGFAAEYGDRLSAVLDVKNREGRTDAAVAGKLDASLTNMNVILEGGLPLAGSSYLLSLRRTYYDLILGPVLKSAKLVDGDVALPNFRDVQGKVVIPIDQGNRIVLNGVTSRDGVDLISGTGRDRPDSISLFDNSYNTLLGATWEFTPEKNFVSKTQVSWYRNSGSGFFDGSFVDPSQNTGSLQRTDTSGVRLVSFDLNYDYVYTKAGLVQQFLLTQGAHSMTLGFGADLLTSDFTRYYQIDPILQSYLESRGLAVPSSITQSITHDRYDAFAEDRIALSDRFFVQPGLRLDLFPNLERQTYLAPRVNVSFKIDDLSTLRAAYGIYYQSPGMEKEDYRYRVVLTEASFGHLVAERADHYILGYDRMLTPEWQFKVETYYKKFLNAIVPDKLHGSAWVSTRTGADIFSPGSWSQAVQVPADSFTTNPVNDASGYSTGVEVMLQKIRSLPTDRFTGWVSYALSSARRLRDGIWTPFLFDQEHAVNVVGNYRFADAWDLGVRFTLRSGIPYVRGIGVKPRILLEEVNGTEKPVMQLDENGKVILDVQYEQDAFSGRLNLYQTLDLRVTTYPRWWGLSWAIYLDVQNIYNAHNEQMTSFYVDTAGVLQQHTNYGLPIFPSLGLSIDF